VKALVGAFKAHVHRGEDCIVSLAIVTAVVYSGNAIIDRTLSTVPE